MKPVDVATSAGPVSVQEAPARARRLRFFQIVFVLTYVGIVMDVVTTALGFRKSGASYEQNPMGALLIGHLGWFGILGLLTAFSLVAYISCKVIQTSKGPGWARTVNVVFVLLAAFRWVAVVTAILYLLQPAG